jgi:hypothetical protein
MALALGDFASGGPTNRNTTLAAMPEPSNGLPLPVGMIPSAIGVCEFGYWKKPNYVVNATVRCGRRDWSARL